MQQHSLWQSLCYCNTNEDTLNAFYNNKIAKKIKRLIKYLSIWTCITYIIATSSSVESEFANIKCRVFKDESSLRVDKFIRYLEYLDVRTKKHLIIRLQAQKLKIIVQTIILTRRYISF